MSQSDSPRRQRFRVEGRAPHRGVWQSTRGVFRTRAQAERYRNALHYPTGGEYRVIEQESPR